MRASEIFESARDEVDLQKIAAEIVEKFKSRLTSMPPKQIDVDLSNIKSIPQTLDQLRSGLVKFELSTPYEPDLGGIFDRNTNTITVFFKTKTQNNTTSLRDEAFVRSTLVHELRHFLDFMLSSGKAFRHDHKYLERPHEINARFSSVQEELVELLKKSIQDQKPLSLREFLNEFENIAESHDLFSIFAKDNESITVFSKTLSQSPMWRPGAVKRAREETLRSLKLPTSSLIGPIENKQYRSLIRRLSALYYYIIEQESK